ncbi:hypothetical protein PG997_000077 [Apiospora hydei]|uniref:Uncharacterized protein n=1 Tax=Apiospora hydei TaxID=1337664 RepID=A0ABR1X9Z2_9PEZI
MCSKKKDGITLGGLDLQAFPNLKQLSWAGAFQDHVDGLASVLDSVSHQLEKLDLDMYLYYSPDSRFMPDWNSEEESEEQSEDGTPDETSLSVCSRVFRLTRPRPLSFPALRDLSLCHIDIDPTDVDRIFGSIDFTQLQSLQLRFCPGSELVLDRLATTSRPRTLRSFALQESDVSFFGSPTRVVPFLEAFEGLEDLFLTIPATKETATEIWRAAAGHHKRRCGGSSSTSDDVREATTSRRSVWKNGTNWTCLWNLLGLKAALRRIRLGTWIPRVWASDARRNGW